MKQRSYQIGNYSQMLENNNNILHIYMKSKGKGKFLIIIFIFIVAIFGIGALMKGKKTSDTTSKPTIKIKAMSKTLNPDEKTGGTEGYTEYLDGETLGTNIDISVTWENGIGLKTNGVKGLLFKRIVGSNVVQSILTTKDDNLEDGAESTVIFKGTDILQGFRENETVGENTVTVEYVTATVSQEMTNKLNINSHTSVTGVDFTPPIQTSFSILQEDLDSTIKIESAKTFSLPVSVGSIEGSFSVKEQTWYRIMSENGYFGGDVRLKTNSDGSYQLYAIKNPVTDETIIEGDGTEMTLEKIPDTDYVVMKVSDDGYAVFTDDRNEQKVVTKNELFSNVDNYKNAIMTIKSYSSTDLIRPKHPKFKMWCFVTPGVSTPTGFQWVNGSFRTDTIENLKADWKAGKVILKDMDGTPSAVSQGYKYVAITITDGGACGSYYLFGKTLPTTGNYPLFSVCRQIGLGQINAGSKLDSTCPLINKNLQQGQGTGTSWAIYDLSSDDQYTLEKGEIYGSLSSEQAMPDSETVVFFDRQHVSCGDDAINQLQFKKGGTYDGIPHARYFMSCKVQDTLANPNNRIFTKPTTDGGDKRMKSLYNQHVTCGTKPLQYFGLARHADPGKTFDKIKYQYDCSPKDTKGECRELSTVKTSVKLDASTNNEDPLYLHNMKCNKDEFLTGFKYRTDWNSVWYDYKCCK